MSKNLQLGLHAQEISNIIMRPLQSGLLLVCEVKEVFSNQIKCFDTFLPERTKALALFYLQNLRSELPNKTLFISD